LRDGGALVHLGNASGAATVDRDALAKRSIEYTQPSTGQYIKDRDTFLKASADVFAALQDDVFGRIGITCYPLSEAARAHADIAARRITGSVILVP
jgi:NADPH2:quinone reductase